MVVVCHVSLKLSIKIIIIERPLAGLEWTDLAVLFLEFKPVAMDYCVRVVIWQTAKQLSVIFDTKMRSILPTLVL